MLAVLMLSGCSADDAARSQLSQTAKETGSASRSAALALGQHEKDRITEPVLDTALSDISEKLGQGAASLTSVTALGGIARQRDSILTAVRRAQDILLSVQADLSEGRGEGRSLDPERLRLESIARELLSTSEKVSRE